VEWKFTTTSGFAGRAAPTDANGNGLPDAWEASYGVTDAQADNDGDGQNNFAEYIARTNPTNASSFLRIIEAKRGSDGRITVTWSSMGGVRYRIQSADRIGGEFTDIVRDAVEETDPGAAGESSNNSFTDALVPADGVRFYRIKVVP
jgi:hypothetical protein